MADNYQSFIAWAISVYGEKYLMDLGMSPQNYQTSNIYTAWVDAGSPRASVMMGPALDVDRTIISPTRGWKPEEYNPWSPVLPGSEVSNLGTEALRWFTGTPSPPSTTTELPPEPPVDMGGGGINPTWTPHYIEGKGQVGWRDRYGAIWNMDGTIKLVDAPFPDDTEMTEYERERAALEREQFEWQKSVYGQGDEDAFDEQKEFELWKAQKQLEWSQPDVRSRNWIKSWLLEQEKGPAFGPEAEGWGEQWYMKDIVRQEAEVMRLAQRLDMATARAGVPGREPEMDLDLATIRAQYDNALTHLNNLKAGLGGIANKPMLPSAPGWLANMTGMQTGAPISAAPITTPSGQSFSKMPFEQRQQLAGYADWASAGGKTRSYRDILDTMAMMQPNDPRIAYNWQPARQRT